MKLSRTRAGLAGFVGACLAAALIFVRPDRPRKEDIPFDPSQLDTPSWVSSYDPSKASGGYNLALYRRRIPMLVDMNGNILHAWPEVRARGRARLTKEGTLIAICTDEAIREFDWDGNLLWQYENDDDDFPHHDLRRLSNGNTLLLYRDLDRGTDYMLEVDGAGRTVWEWRSGKHLADFLNHEKPEDQTHINSVQELPPNKWHDAGDSRFKPGNLLISAREVDMVFIIDRETGEAVWRYGRELDHQHEALMIERDYPGAGNIQLFNNGFNDKYHYRESAILEIDPIEKSVVWQYSADHFFSHAAGCQQHLPNGNVLITSTHGGRVFEIDRAGNIVWQWVPSSGPMRLRRYAYDYSPRFAKFGRPSEQSVARKSKPFLDKDLYAFGRSTEFVEKDIAGKTREILFEGALCRDLVLPDEPILRIGYGLYRKTIAERGAADPRATFEVRIQNAAGEERLLTSDVVKLEERGAWTETTIGLREYARSGVTLCLEAKADGLYVRGRPRSPTFWENPRVEPLSSIPEGQRAEVEAPDPRTEEALRQLEALGYVE